MSRPKSRVAQRCGGVFTPDPDTPGDGRRQVCRCGLLGEPGDTHHQLPDIPEQAAVRGRYDHDEEA